MRRLQLNVKVFLGNGFLEEHVEVLPNLSKLVSIRHDGRVPVRPALSTQLRQRNFHGSGNREIRTSQS